LYGLLASDWQSIARNDPDADPEAGRGVQGGGWPFMKNVST
jgi:hypothetical protein